MFRTLALAVILLLPSHSMATVSWSFLSQKLNVRCGNYCDVSGDRTADSNNGSTATGDFWWGKTDGAAPFLAMSRSRMQSYGFKNTKGLVVNYARTIGLSGDRAMLHMGTGYPTSGGYLPVYATRTSNGWNLEGPVKVEGRVRPIFSSSMAYVYRNGVHWMIQDAGAYGFGKLVAFRSTDGMNWSKVGGDIASLTGDSGPSWPDLIHHDGRWHLVFTPRWDNGNVRHLSSADMTNWRVENKNALYAYKGCNLLSRNGHLECHSNGKLWRADLGSSGGGTEGHASCTDPKVEVSGRDAKASWVKGDCRRKLVGPMSDFAKDTDGGHVYLDLPEGSYAFRIRTADGAYSSAYFKIPASTTDGSSSGGDAPPATKEPCTQPSVVISGRDAATQWVIGDCRRKLVGPVGSFARDLDGAHTYQDLPDGEYAFRVRTADGAYSSAYFSIPAEKESASGDLTGDPTPCSGLEVIVNGRDAEGRYSPGDCRLKLIRDDLTHDFRSDADGSHLYRDLPIGDYRFQVRTSDGDYAKRSFRIR